MPLLKSRKSIYSLYQRLGDDDEEESGVEESYEKFSSTISSEFNNNDQRCNLSKDSSSEKSIEINLKHDDSSQSTCNTNTDHGINKNVNETNIQTMFDHSKENEVTRSILNISNLSINDNENINDQGTNNYDIYDVVTENIYACIDEDIYATVNDSIDNKEDEIYASVDDTIYNVIDKQDKKIDTIVSPNTKDKYDAIVVLDSVVKDDKIEIVNKGISSDFNMKTRIDTSSESEVHPIPRKILIPVRKAPPPPIKPPFSKSSNHANNLTGRKNHIKRITFPPDVIIGKESIYQIPTVKYSTLDSKNDNLSRRSCEFKPYEKYILRKPRESQYCHESSSYKGGSISSTTSETSAKIERNPIYDVTFNSPIVHQRGNTEPLSSEAPPLPPKEKVKYEVRSVNKSPIPQVESTITTSGSPDRNPNKQDPMSTHIGHTPIEDDITPGCSPEILRDLRHGLMKSEGRPLRESAIFYTKAQPYPDDTYMYDDEVLVSGEGGARTGPGGLTTGPGGGMVVMPGLPYHWYDEPPYESDPEDLSMGPGKDAYRDPYTHILRGGLKEEDIISLRTAGDITLPRDVAKAAAASQWAASAAGASYVLRSPTHHPHPTNPQHMVHWAEVYPSSRGMNTPYEQPIYDNIRVGGMGGSARLPRVRRADGPEYHNVEALQKAAGRRLRHSQQHDCQADVHSVTSRLSNVSVETNRSDPSDLRISKYTVTLSD